MSHFSELKTNLTTKAYLTKALIRMGFEVVEEEGGVDVRGFFGATKRADFKILTKTHYDIGFVKNATGAYELVGDWELLPTVSGIEQDLFLKHLKREYARTAIEDLAAR